ncbi:MAG: hypothetical protein ACOCTG_07125 [Bacteroidota bacterium]
MDTVTAAVFALWAFPIIGITIAHFRLSRRVKRDLEAIAANRSMADREEAARCVHSVRPMVFDTPASLAEAKNFPGKGTLRVSGSGRVDVRALNERRLFSVSAN